MSIYSFQCFPLYYMDNIINSLKIFSLYYIKAVTYLFFNVCKITVHLKNLIEQNATTVESIIKLLISKLMGYDCNRRSSNIYVQDLGSYISRSRQYKHHIACLLFAWCCLFLLSLIFVLITAFLF